MSVRGASSSLACLAVLVGLAACGSVSTSPAPAVRLSLERPADDTVTLAQQVVVRGSVAAPGAASVLVAGRRVTVSGGAFAASVAVRPGTNVIDVLAGAPGRRPAMTAVRVYRELPVEVPRLDGRSTSAASTALRRLGLTPRVHDGSGFFQGLLPLSKDVCTSSPAPGRWVAPGTTVTLEIAKIC